LSSESVSYVTAYSSERGSSIRRADPFAVSFERKPMHIKKLTNSNALKWGELLIVCTRST